MNRELYDQFLIWLSVAHSHETVSSYRWGIKIFMDWLDGHEKEILKLKQNDFLDYTIYLRDKRQVKHSTAASYIGALRTFWRWLYRQGLVKFDESFIQTPLVDDREHYPFIVKQEIDLILAHFDEFYPEQLREKTVISFLSATGLRLGEMLEIEISQLDLEKQKATIRTFKRHNHFREIYWDEETNRLLKKWLDTRDKFMEHSRFSNNRLFISLAYGKVGKPISKSTTQKMFRKIRRDLGITKKITAHSFRHGYGHRAVEQNVHPRHLQLLLGHAKLNSTMCYMGVANQELENIYRLKMA